MEAYLTIEECAEKLRLSPKTIYSWIRKGLLEAVAFGRNYRVAESELERYVKTLPHKVPNNGRMGRKG